jgi:hypothetical protein
VSGNLGSVPIAPEVDLFEREIGGDDDFFSRARAQNRAIVANAHSDHSFLSGGAVSNRGDQRPLPNGGLAFLTRFSRLRSSIFHFEAQE